jgi:hypothetical protein
LLTLATIRIIFAQFSLGLEAPDRIKSRLLGARADPEQAKRERMKTECEIANPGVYNSEDAKVALYINHVNGHCRNVDVFPVLDP